VRLRNAGNRSASYFRFNVKINGQDVPEYKVYLYAVNIDPGTAGEVALNNFYSPAGTKAFEVQVTLVEAQWMEVTKDRTSTTTTPTGAVAGLPIATSVSVTVSPLARGSGPKGRFASDTLGVPLPTLELRDRLAESSPTTVGRLSS
jgi:hypothetical protein